jgi:hypothetical protein
MSSNQTTNSLSDVIGNVNIDYEDVSHLGHVDPTFMTTRDDANSLADLPLCLRSDIGEYLAKTNRSPTKTYSLIFPKFLGLDFKKIGDYRQRWIEKIRFAKDRSENIVPPVLQEKAGLDKERLKRSREEKLENAALINSEQKLSDKVASLLQQLEKSNFNVSKLESAYLEMKSSLEAQMDKLKMDFEDQLAKLNEDTLEQISNLKEEIEELLTGNHQRAKPSIKDQDEAWNETHIFIDYSNLHISLLHQIPNHELCHRKSSDLWVDLDMLHDMLVNVDTFPNRRFHSALVAGNDNLLYTDGYSRLREKFPIDDMKDTFGSNNCNYTGGSRYRFVTTEGRLEFIIDNILHAELLRTALDISLKTPGLGRTKSRWRYYLYLKKKKEDVL